MWLTVKGTREGRHVNLMVPRPTEWSAYPAFAIQSNPDQVISTVVRAVLSSDFNNPVNKVTNLILSLTENERRVVDRLLHDLSLVKDITSGTTHRMYERCVNGSGMLHSEGFPYFEWPLAPVFSPVGMLIAGVRVKDRGYDLKEEDWEWLDEIERITVFMSRDQNGKKSVTLSIDKLTPENVLLFMLIIYVVSQSKRIGCRLQNIIQSAHKWGLDRNGWGPFVSLHDEIEQILNPHGHFVRSWLGLCLGRYQAWRSDEDIEMGRKEQAGSLAPELREIVAKLKRSKADTRSTLAREARESLEQLADRLELYHEGKEADEQSAEALAGATSAELSLVERSLTEANASVQAPDTAVHVPAH